MEQNRTPPPEDRTPRRHGIALQHEKLAGLCAELQERLQSRDDARCLAIASRLKLALESHFTVEESVLYPGLRTRHPELRAQIDALEDDHASVRRQLEQLSFCIGATSHGQAAMILARVRELLDGHETREERHFAKDAEDFPER